jgi:hypothetical protein
MGRIQFDDLQWERGYSKWFAYGQSKLANLLFTFELQRRTERAGVNLISVACHPGYAATNLQAAGPRMQGFWMLETAMDFANQLFAQSAAMGALPLLYAAAASDVGGGTTSDLTVSVNCGATRLKCHAVLTRVTLQRPGVFGTSPNSLPARVFALVSERCSPKRGVRGHRNFILQHSSDRAAINANAGGAACMATGLSRCVHFCGRASKNQAEVGRGTANRQPI